ncbi:Pkinase-domain-containing protein [Schizopora paradoxa]|uniref:Pkinase-domain-containing protein n=1 Tax=Schizopora paradoxa TaxID=27342 RepID=A0A0H2RRN4_9AGAM|nr:Pkinase-domain-containing protein [Schizopora paradoxa]
MTDDGQSVAPRGANRRRIRGPLHIVNQGSDSEEDNSRPPFKHDWNPPLPSPISRSPYSEHDSLPSTSYTPRNNILPHHHQTPSVEDAPFVPPLSSPSSSSSPPGRSTPPPSTPGVGAAPRTSFNGSTDYEDNNQAPDDGSDSRQPAAGRPTYYTQDKVNKNIPPCLQPSMPSRPATSPTYPTNPSHSSPTYQSNPSREQVLPKILLMLTTDCELYVQLDVTGARSGAYIKEKMFTKLQISDDQQPFFSIYRTDIGSFALSESLSDDRLLEMCRNEGDGKGSVKFLVQHSSAALHLQSPPSRYVAPSHIPPVLPDQQSFRSPNNHRARSVRSNHDSKSSTSEHYFADGLQPSYEESASDEDLFDKERPRNTIRPPPSNKPSTYFNPSSPLDARRVNGSVRDPSPPKLSLSPARTRNIDTLSPVVNDRNRFASTPVNSQFSPNRPYDDGSFTPPPSRRAHNYSASDAAAERERAMELAERDRMPRKADRVREAQGRRRGYEGSESSVRRTEEPWVVVKNVPRSASNARPGLHTPSNSHPSEIRFNNNYSSSFSASRTNLPQVPPPPRNAPPPIPSSTSNYTNRPALAVPSNWPVKGIPGLGENFRMTSKSARLQAAKSMDNLRGMNSPMPGTAQRKQSQNSMSRPSVAGLREAATTQAASQGSFMNMEMSPPSRRDPNLPRSVNDRNFTSSPTGYTPRPFAVNVSQSQSDNSMSSQATFSSNRPPPIQVQPSSANSSSTLLSVTGGQGPRKSPDDLFPRPHSALDDIGASPAPSRHVRPLPSTGNHGGSQSGSNSWIDVDSIFDDSPRVTSPHPYASQLQQTQSQAARPSTAGSVVQSNSQQSARQCVPTPSSAALADSFSLDLPSTMSDSTIVQPPRTMRIAPNPDSPRRTPLDNRMEKRDNDASNSFTPLQDAKALEKELDGNSTLKQEDHGYLVNLLGGSSGEGTLKQSTPRSLTDKTVVAVANVPAPAPMAKTESGQSAYTNTTEGDEYDDEDFDDASSLWKVPSKPPVPEPPKRPNLVVDTDNEKSPLTPSMTSSSQTVTRSPGVPLSLRPNQGVPPNFPPPNFPPPPPPPLRRPRPSNQRPRDGKSDGNKRASQFVKSSAEAWDFRPPAESIYGQMDAFFPDHDLDKPVIEQSISGGTSPTTAEPNIPPFQNTQSEKEKRFNKKKSIRIVAAEHKKKIEDRISKAETQSSVIRKRSTKLWGSKVEEVTPFAIPNLPATVPESPTAPNPKLAIFKWVRGELIGKGTYGRVYLALNATTGEMIAVKQVEIPKTDADRGDSRQAIVVEALKMESETLKDLDHPNIVQYLGFEQTPDFLSIFLEYVPGGSVAGCLRKHGKFEDQITRSFTGQILEGLEYLHNNGIIHRDLKADNILVDPSGICKISDFGISKRTADIEENGIHTSMKGSVFWMAPEVVQAARKGEQHGYNGKVDIWSLGCVVLEMWAGRRPWQDVDAIAVIFELITKQQAPPVPDDVVLTPDADDFRQKCFYIKPDERPSASELRKHPYLTLRQDWMFTGFK